MLSLAPPPSLARRTCLTLSPRRGTGTAGQGRRGIESWLSDRVEPYRASTAPMILSLVHGRGGRRRPARRRRRHALPSELVARSLQPCEGCGRPTRSRWCSTCVPAPNPMRTSHRQHRRVRAIVLSSSSVCAECGKAGTASDPLTLEHVIPRSRGGQTAVENSEALHRSCNSRMGGDRKISNA